MTRFLAVDLNLAGGAAPSTPGLQWLVDKGYRTLLDLREPSEVPPSFIADVTRKGLRYVALPVSVKTIDRDHVDRFHFEVADGGARPLFFFDSDGTRAGALWYIRRVAVDHIDSQTARREAEELGLAEKTAWLAATSYVAKLGGSSSGAPPAAPTISSEPKSPAAAIHETSNNKSATTPRLNDAVAADASAKAVPNQLESRSATGSMPVVPSSPQPTQTGLPASSPVAGLTGRDQADTSSSNPIVPMDFQAWRPFAAMVITGLSVPVVFWTSSVVPAILTRTRASLPAPAPRPKSLLASSGD